MMRQAPSTRNQIGEFYTEVVLPALAAHLDTAFPEFGWRCDPHGWTATNNEMTHSILGVRADRVVAHGAAPTGFLVHGGEPMLWTAYLNGGAIPHGEQFVATVKELAHRVGIDTAALEQAAPRDRRVDLLEDFHALCRQELLSERGASGRAYLAQRGIGANELEGSRLGIVPDRGRSIASLRETGYQLEEINSAGLYADSRWPGRIIGGWRDERDRIQTLWTRSLAEDGDAGSRYLYLRGASRSALPPYGLSDLLARNTWNRTELLVVEGFFDLHRLRASGIANVAALGGTGMRPRSFELLARLGVAGVTLCLDGDEAGRSATAKAVENAARATESPTVFVIDPARLAPAKDPDELVRQHGPDALRQLAAARTSGIQWRAEEFTAGIDATSPSHRRRAGLARAGRWLGTLPPRLALEQEDALHAVATQCGYSEQAVERAFQARFWHSDRGLTVER